MYIEKYMYFFLKKKLNNNNLKKKKMWGITFFHPYKNFVLEISK